MPFPHLLAAVVSATAWGTGLFTILFSLASVPAARRLLRPRSRPRRSPLPPMTILKPIKGLDREMHRNLASFLGQDYPAFQVVFCLQSPDDPALPILKKLRADFPGTDMDIVVSSGRVGHNPKINNLSNAEPFIKYDLVMISDSDIRLGPGDLRRLVDPLLEDPSTGLVTCLYQSQGARGLGGAMEFLSVNAQFLPQAIVAAGLGGMRFAMGAVMLVPRKVLAQTGGFANLSHHLADDFCLGQSVRRLGYRIALAEPVVVSVPDDWGFIGHFAHLVRWSRTIRVCQPAGYLASFITHGFALSCLTLLVNGPGAGALALAAAVAAARAASVAAIHLGFTGNPEILARLPLLPLNDLVQFLAWLAGFNSRTVTWRGEEYYIQSSGRLTPVGLQETSSRSPVGAA